jgi:TonB family protein
MYFDFEDDRPDISPVGNAISWREGVLFSIILHLMGVIALLFAPELLTSQPVATEASNASPVLEDDPTRFVFVQPRIETPAPEPPPRAAPSDLDRTARAPEIAPDPQNELPFSRGDTFERVDPVEAETARGQPQPESANAATDAADRRAEQVSPDREPELQARLGENSRLSGGSLGDALRNLERYVQPNRFDNEQGGGGSFGPAIQFDTKGVEFGPWIRRFIAQVRRNWEPLIPQAAWSMHGHVVVTFNVQKSGRITDLSVVKSADLDAFNTAAYGALASSSPTVPLPPEYPADQAFFTVTFYYNEQPPAR